MIRINSIFLSYENNVFIKNVIVPINVVLIYVGKLLFIWEMNQSKYQFMSHILITKDY